LRCQELYDAFTETVGQKLGTDNVAIYIHEKKERTLRLAYNRGDEVTTRMFSLDDHEIFRRMVQQEVMTRASIEADQVLRQFFTDKDLDWQGPGIWIPLNMQSDLVGLVVAGYGEDELPENDYGREFLESISSHAAV